MNIDDQPTTTTSDSPSDTDESDKSDTTGSHPNTNETVDLALALLDRGMAGDDNDTAASDKILSRANKFIDSFQTAFTSTPKSVVKSNTTDDSNSDREKRPANSPLQEDEQKRQCSDSKSEVENSNNSSVTQTNKINTKPLW